MSETPPSIFTKVPTQWPPPSRDDVTVHCYAGPPRPGDTFELPVDKPELILSPGISEYMRICPFTTEGGASDVSGD